MKAFATLFMGIILTTGSLRAQDVNVLVSNVAGAATNNPVVGPGYVVRAVPHADLNIVWNATTKTFTGGFRTADEAVPVQFASDKAIAYLPPTGRRQRTSSSTQFDFQGAMGATYWIFPSSSPSSNSAQTLYLGLSAYGVPNDGTFAPLPPSTTGRIIWTVHSVENLSTPSANAFYGYGVSAGNVNMQLTTDPAYPSSNREVSMLANGHTHLNLLFRAAGMYRITFRIRGTLASTGQEVSSLVPVYVGVEQWQIPAAAAPSITLAGNLAFGNVTVGQTATRTLTISNTGNAPLSVTGISYPSGFSGNWNSGNIAAGSSTNVTVSFTPNTATSFGGNITVNSDATSGVNTIPASGSGTPESVSYTAWRDARFSPAQAADPLVSGSAADPDGDGFANLEEYAFGGDPLVPDAALLAPRLRRSGNSWILTVRQRTDASGLTITPLATASLQPGLADWRSDLLTPQGQPRNVAAGIDEFDYLLNGGLTDNAFLRVRAQLASP